MFDEYSSSDFKKANDYDDDMEDNHSHDGNSDGESGDDQKETMLMNPTSVRERIDESLEILANLKNRKSATTSRSEIIASLARDLSEYYGYLPELSEMFLDMFSSSECVEFMDAGDRQRPLVIRANTLKTTRKDLMEALTKRGSTLEAIDWSKVAIKVTESSVPIGATPEYLAGHYMLQSAASMNPVMALAPVPGERILDMSAAPGGKTTYIAQLMKNSGVIIANDLKPQRQKATIANLHRMGVKNAIVCCYDGRKIPHIMKGFDRVLLDAPCSGLGVISRDQSVKLQRTVKDIQRIAHLQKELLCAAVDAVDCKSKSGGVVVYSTCSISVEENEQVIQYILQKRFVRLIETGLEVGKPGFTRYKDRRFHQSMALTRRFYPHVHNMDGFYVAKLVKYENGVRGAAEDDNNEAAEQAEEEEGEGSEDNVEDEEGDGEEPGDDQQDEKVVEEIVIAPKSNKNSKKSEVVTRTAVTIPALVEVREEVIVKAKATKKTAVAPAVIAADSSALKKAAKVEDKVSIVPVVPEITMNNPATEVKKMTKVSQVEQLDAVPAVEIEEELEMPSAHLQERSTKKKRHLKSIRDIFKRSKEQ